MTRSRVAIIGGGIFGVSAALELALEHEVVLFEQSDELLTGATLTNHNRHHYGFHYPRSAATALQCLAARTSFEELYAPALVWDFDNYYCVAADATKTSATAYLAFCRAVSLPFEERWPPEGVVDRSRIALSLQVQEPVYDHAILSALVRDRLRSSNVIVRPGHRVVGASITGDGTKRLDVYSNDARAVYDADVLINATYAAYNRACGWLGFARRTFQFNLQELAVIRLPRARRIGLTIQDGSFPSFLPLGHTDEFLFAHVDASQLVREISDADGGLLGRTPAVHSNFESTREQSAEWSPVLAGATLVRSIFADRVVDPARSDDDARLTEITAHGHGCWSIFGAKVITAVETARRLRRLVGAAT